MKIYTGIVRYFILLNGNYEVEYSAGIPLASDCASGIELVVLISHAQLKSFVIMLEMRSL